MPKGLSTGMPEEKAVDHRPAFAPDIRAIFDCVESFTGSQTVFPNFAPDLNHKRNKGVGQETRGQAGGGINGAMLHSAARGLSAGRLPDGRICAHPGRRTSVCHSRRTI